MSAHIPPPLPSANILACEKCHSAMQTAKVYRLSSVLVFIGYTLLIPSVLVLLLLLLFTFAGIAGTSAASHKADSDRLRDAIISLQKIDGIPHEFVVTFS